MKVIIVYDTVSPMKLTAKVAESIGGVLKEKGIEVDSFFVNDVDKGIVKNYDCVLAGSPTQILRATEPIMQFLDRFAKDEFSGKLAAAFDTQLQSRLSGNAANGIEKKLKKLGFKIVMPPLVTYVEGKMNEYNLKEGELEKAKNWAQTVAEVLSKQKT
jgi:flavodoxin